MIKTNAMRMLDSAGIKYIAKEYAYDENDLAGIHAAEAIGMPAEQVFKTLVTKGDKTGVTVFCVSVADELDLKKAAIVSGNKSMEMLPMKSILETTGYIRGGCSPIGMKKKYSTFIDEQAILFDEIGISAGARGCQLTLNPEMLRDFLDAEFHNLAK